MAMDTGTYVAGESIYIPISGTDEAVALNVDDLPRMWTTCSASCRPS